MPDSELLAYDHFTQKMLQKQFEFLKTYDAFKLTGELLSYDTLTIEILGIFYYHINQGDLYFFAEDTMNLAARDQYLTALELAISNENVQLVCEALKKLLDLNRLGYLYDNTTVFYYLNIYDQYAYDDLERVYLEYYRLVFSYRNDPILGEWDDDRAKTLEDFAQSSSHHFINARIFNLLANHAYNADDQFEIAYSMNLQAQKNLDQIHFGYKSTLQKQVNIGITRHALLSGRMSLADSSLSAMDTIANNSYEHLYIRYYFYYQAALDTAADDFESASDNLWKYSELTAYNEMYNNQNDLRFLETEYQTERRDFAIKEQAKQITYQERFLWTFGVLLLVLMGFTAVLILAFSKIRQKNHKIETLIRELHHRVKNNLQIVSSLLGLQSMKLEDQLAKKAVNEGKGRIRAMALIHQKLYQNEEVTVLKINEYLTNLIHEITQAYGHLSNEHIEIAIVEKSFDADKALSIGLIVNELVSNAFKYAFINTDNPRLIVKLVNVEETYILTVGDNGPGLPQGYDLNRAESFGMKLVNLLVKQLKGVLKYENDTGLRCIVEFSTT